MVVIAAVASIAAGLAYVAMDPVPLRRERDLLRATRFGGIVTDISEGVAYLRRMPWLWRRCWYLRWCSCWPHRPDRGAGIPFVLRERASVVTPPITCGLVPPPMSRAAITVTFASIPMPRRYLTIMFAIWGVSSLLLVPDGCGERPLGRDFVAVSSPRRAVRRPGWSCGARCCSGALPAALFVGRRLDFFVSVALPPVSMAIAARWLAFS